MDRFATLITFGAAASALLAHIAGAAVVVNGGFENPSALGGYTINFSATTPANDGNFIANWGSANTGGYFSYGVQDPAGNGNFSGGNGQSAFINVLPNQQTPGESASIYQDCGVLLPDTTYTLSLELGNRSDFGDVPELSASYAMVNGTDPTGILLASNSDGPITNSSTANLSYVTPLTFTTGATVSGDLTIGGSGTEAVVRPTSRH